MPELKFVFVGAESTGTTTVSSLVAERLRSRQGFEDTPWVREFGRDWTEIKLTRAQAENPSLGMDDLSWTPEDFALIASKQNELEDQAFALNPRLAIMDTDSWATTLWERRYMGATSQGTFRAALEARPVTFYFVTDHEGVPFMQDGFRDGELIRPEMTEWFISGLRARKAPFEVLDGRLDDRVDLALKRIDSLV